MKYYQMNRRNNEVNMDNFMIGQYGKYDFDKFHRDYRKDFYGIEAFMLNSEEDIDHLIAESKRYNFNIGIHFPLRSGVHELRDQLFLASDENIRVDAFRCIEDELNFR